MEVLDVFKDSPANLARLSRVPPVNKEEVDSVEDLKEKTIRKSRFKGNGILKQKFLRKRVKGSIPGYSARKFISNIAQSTDPLVREVEREETVRDDRSLFFKDEFIKEKREMRRGVL